MERRMKNKKDEEDFVSGTFTWVIDNFSKLKTDKHYSDVFTIRGFKWRILICRKGSHDPESDVVDQLSMYLGVADASTLTPGWATYTHFSFTLVNQLDSSKSKIKQTQGIAKEFKEERREWGYKSFIPLCKLYDCRAGYLVNDICIIEAKVDVFVNIGEQGSTAYATVLVKGPANKSEEAERRAVGKQPCDDDGGLAELDKRRRGLEMAIHDVMGRSELPPFDLDPPPKLPLGLEELFPEGTEDTDFVEVRRQKKDVTLAMHHQEVPLVNAFLAGVKMDAGELARTKATNFSDRVQKSVMSAANAFGDMYLTLAKAEKKVALARCHSETAKAAIAEAQAAIRERNSLQLKVGKLERELKETARRLEEVEEARAKAERKKGEELAAACAKAVEEYKGSDEFKNLLLDPMVEEQFGWEKLLARFNSDFDINFDISGVPPPIPPGRELLFASPLSADPITSPDAEARDGAEVGGGDAVPKAEPVVGEVLDEGAEV